MNQLRIVPMTKSSIHEYVESKLRDFAFRQAARNQRRAIERAKRKQARRCATFQQGGLFE